MSGQSAKHRGWLIFGGLILLLVVAVAVCEWLEWPFLRGPLERTLSQTLGRQVSLGRDFGVRLIGPIRMHDDSIVIGSPPGAPTLEDDKGQARDFLRAGDARVVLPWSTVIALVRSRHDEPVRVRALEVGQLDLNLVRNADGKANWTFGAANEASAAPPAVPQFEKLVVGEGNVRVRDAMSKLQLDAAVKTREGSAIALDSGRRDEGAGVQIKATGQYKGKPLDVDIHSSGLLPLAATGENAAPVPVRLDVKYGAVRVKLDGRAQDVLQLTGVDGDFEIAGPSLAAVGDLTGLTLPTTAAFDLKGAIHKQGTSWSGSVSSLSLGSSRLSGEFKYDPRPKVPQFTGTLSGERLALADLGPALGGKSADERKPPGEEKEKEKETGEGKQTTARKETKARAAREAREKQAKQKATAKEKTAQGKEAGDRLLPRREFSIPSLGAMNAEIEVNLDTADLGTSELEVFRPLKARVELHDKVLTVKDLMAHTSGGELRGTLSMDANPPDPVWNADLKWAGIQLERFVKPRNPLNTKNKDRSDGKGAPGYIEGQLSGRAKLEGTGRSTAAMLGSLDGSSELWIKDGAISHLLLELMGLDAAQALGVAVSGDTDLPMRCAVARLTVKDGLVQPELAVIDTTDTTLLLTGEISLVTERLSIVLTAKPKDFSLVSLRSPVLVDGTFAHPKVSIDATEVGLKLAGAAVLAAAVAPAAALLALFDMGEKEKHVCGQAVEGMKVAPPEVKRKARNETMGKGEATGKGDAKGKGEDAGKAR